MMSTPENHNYIWEWFYECVWFLLKVVWGGLCMVVHLIPLGELIVVT